MQTGSPILNSHLRMSSYIEGWSNSVASCTLHHRCSLAILQIILHHGLCSIFSVAPPTEVATYDCSDTSVSLRWEEPEFDGGHKITGYNIEMLSLPSKLWSKLNNINVSETEFKVENILKISLIYFKLLSIR